MTPTTPPSADRALLRDVDSIERYRERGYLQIVDFLTAAELEQLRQLYDELLGQVIDEYKRTVGEPLDTAKLEQGYMIPVNRPEQLRPELLETAAYHKARLLVAELLGVEAERLEVHGRIWHKPAMHGLPTPWHQDEPAIEREDIVTSATVIVAVDESTVENGCLRYIPLSFNGAEILAHGMKTDGQGAQFAGTQRSYSVEPDLVDEELAQAVPLPAGGACVHHPRTLHSTGWNRSNGPRRSLAIRYVLIERPSESTRESD